MSDKSSEEFRVHPPVRRMENMPIVTVVIIRSIIGFFLLLVLVKMVGKQQVTQLTYFDYIVGITIGSIASTLSVQVNENSWATIEMNK